MARLFSSERGPRQGASHAKALAAKPSVPQSSGGPLRSLAVQLSALIGCTRGRGEASSRGKAIKGPTHAKALAAKSSMPPRIPRLANASVEHPIASKCSGRVH